MAGSPAICKSKRCCLSKTKALADAGRPSYGADWGDYISFAERMRERAEADGADLLLIDTGDRIEGNGLYDASNPKGQYLYEIFKQQHIDLICSGNHELYKRTSSESELNITVPNFKGNYLASNIDIIDPKTGEWIPLAQRYKKLTTKNQGIRIVAFGFLFDFTRNFNNTIVQPVEETVKEEWFQEAIRDEDVDLFVVIGHVPAHSKEFEVIFREIRSVRWDTPIQFFAGHQHIRDYAKYDAKAYALASGRFLETVGFMSIDDVRSSNPQFNRRYIDFNLISLYHHTGLNESTFPTEHGKETTRQIAMARKALDLDYTYGCAPKDLWLNRAPYPSEDSVYSWLEEQVFPDTLRDEQRKDTPALAIINTGAIRFDIFKGPFTRDTTYIMSPFTNRFKYVPGVPLATAKRLVEVLNKQPQVMAESLPRPLSYISLAPPQQMAYKEDIIVETMTDPLQQSGQKVLQESPRIIPGYTTVDDAGDDGDDTVHSPISFYRVPNCLQSLVSHGQQVSDSDTVDLVYNEFIEPYVALAAKFSGLDVDFEKDSGIYMNGTMMNDLLVSWVKEHWKCD